MAIVATSVKPSSTNIKGGLAEGLVGIVTTLAVGGLTKAGYVAVAASFLGVPEASIIAAAATLIGVLVNVGVTHIAELREADDFIKAFHAMLPTTYAEYPEGKRLGASITNLKSGGNPVNGGAK